MRVVGVDGCSGGWVAVALEDGVFESARVARDLSEILTQEPGAKAVAVDIPIGAERGRFRRVDAAARELLGSRRSTLFETPPLEVFACEDYRSALALCRKLTGRGLSRQSHGLREKILEVAAVVRSEAIGRRVVEVHPELSFRALAGQRPMPSKKTWTGASLRRELLEKASILLPADLGPAGSKAGVDDVLDAAAAAWTAHRFALGKAERVGPRLRDRQGREIA